MLRRPNLLPALLLSLSTFCIGVLSASARADVLFDQMTNYSTTGIVGSCWFPPDGFDSDIYSYDNFRLASSATITEVWWVGGNGYGTAYGSISGVTVRFYTGLASSPNSQPTITALPESETSADYLAGYAFSGTANETVIPGTSLFQYHVVLPTPLSLPGNTTFWIKIEGDSVNQFDGWGLAVAGSGIDSYHIDYVTGRHSFLPASRSEAFQLRGTFTSGACCLSSGSCTAAATAAACAGTFQGAGTACASVSCPQPSGACCLPTGSCTTAANATACAGVFQGAGSTCATVSCPQPPGACCLPSGSCTTAANAGACAGTFQGAGSACATISCPQPPGACCNGTTCGVSTLATCTGVFQGAGSVCGPSGNPTTCCPANFDGVNGLQVADIFTFLSAWFAGDPRADFDGVAGIQVADIFAFLSAWFTGCP